MNGLEAIELMKQGKTVKLYGTDIKFKIENERVINVNPDVCGWNFIVNGKYEVVEDSKTLTGWERLKDGSEYCYISPSGDFLNSTEDSCDYDDLIYKKANYFSTKEKAEEINFKQTLFRKLQRFSDENGGSEIDWSDRESQKYFIMFIHSHKNKFVVDSVYSYQYFGQVYFVSEEVANKAIELFHDDLIKYFTHDWSKGE